MALQATQRDESRVERAVSLRAARAAEAVVALDRSKPSGSMAWDTRENR